MDDEALRETFSEGESLVRTKPWYRVWAQAVSRPSAETYKQLAHAPGVSGSRAMLWVFSSAFLGFLLVLGLATLLSMKNAQPSSGQPLLWLVIFSLIGGVFVLVIFGLNIGISHILARLLGGKGTSSGMAFANAAIFSPYLLVLALLVLLLLITTMIAPESGSPVSVLVLAAGGVIGLLYLFSTCNVLRGVHQIGVVQALIAVIAGVIVTNGLLGAAINGVSLRLIMEGPSMNPGLATGQSLLISRLPYILSVPQRGDIIFFYPPDDPASLPFVKRIIGLPGETLEIRDGLVYINDSLLDEPYIKEPCKNTCHDHIWHLEAHQYFVMGDNRNHSRDSRTFPVPVTDEHIVGKVLFRYWPLGEAGIVA